MYEILEVSRAAYLQDYFDSDTKHVYIKDLIVFFQNNQTYSPIIESI